MKQYGKLYLCSESMKGSELRPEGMEPARIDNAFLQRPDMIDEGKSGAAENVAHNDDHEEKLEELMRNVKAFIRNIDISRL